jgi:SAM-dependent methyltransferase
MGHYRDDRLSPDHRFDRVETTISHLLREPHPALGGRAFGPALLDGLDAAGHGPGRRGPVVEVGGGAGWLGRACVTARPELAWCCIDISRPALLAQRHRVGGAAGRARSAFLRAEATALPLASGSVTGLLLANEVIADLPVGEARKDGEGGELAGTGAEAFVREVSRCLAPGGTAALVEFGGGDPIQPVRLRGGFGGGDHTEHTVHFPSLESVARAHGLEARVVPLYDLLGIDGSVRVASHTDLRRLAALVPGTSMVAVTAEELRRRHPWLTRLFRFELPRLDSPRFPDAEAGIGAAEAFKALLLRAD